MQDGEFCLREFLHNQPIKNYKEWKTRRKTLVKTLGPYLLTFSEIELTAIFAKIETELHELLLQSPTPEHELLGLLEISILHFFRKSYDQIKDLFPLISNQTSSMNRDVCRASTCCLRYLAEESIDNIIFLREVLESAKSYLSTAQGNRFIFNALSILREVGRFLPTEIFVLTLNHMSDIWRAACSDDLELRLVAVKVIRIHLINAPTNVKETFAQSIFVDCEKVLSESKPEPYHGAVLVCQTIYEHFPSIFTNKKISNLLSEFLKAASIQNAELLSAIYDFVIILIQHDPKIFEPKANEYLLVLISQLMNGVGIPKLLNKLISLLHIYSMNQFENVMVQSVVDLVSFLGPKEQYYEHNDLIFEVLLTLFTLHPTITAPSSLFLRCRPCKKYLQAIRARPNIIREIRDYLMEQFGVGIQMRASLNEQYVSVTMVQLFNNLLFEAAEPIYEMLVPFIHSPYEKVRVCMAKTLAMFKSTESNQELVKMAVMDEAKVVRLKALKYVDPSLLVMMPESVTQLLVDPSFKVRRMSMPIISIALQMSVIIAPFIVVFMNNFFANNVAHSSPSRSAKTCSLLPVIAQSFQNGFEPFMSIIPWLCLQFLLNGDEIETVNSNTYVGDFRQVDISKCPHHDMIANCFSTSTQISEKDVNKMRVYRCENEKWLEKRDSYLFITLGNLAHTLMPYLKQIMPVFVKTFRANHTELVYLSAIDALIKIVLASESRINFLTSFPDLLPSLLRLLSEETTTQQLAIAILKLTGTIGASKSSFEGFHDVNFVEKLISVKSNAYFTSFVMNKLIEIMKKEATPLIFEALTSIFVNDTEHAVQYIGPVIKSMIKAIEHDPDRSVLWNQLELICVHCESYISPFINDMAHTLVANINNINCVRVSIALSFYLKVQFIPVATKMYPVALHLLDTPDDKLFHVLIKLVSYALLFQHQCTELFIELTEKLLNSVINDYKITQIMKTLSLLLQLRPMAVYSARIARMALHSNRSLPEVHQVIYNLCIFGYMSSKMLDKIDNVPEIQKLKDAIERGEMIIENLPFIKKCFVKYTFKKKGNTKNIMPTFKNAPENIFKNPKKSQYNNSRMWLEELCQQVVINSPVISIRSCFQVIGQSQQFRNDLFPIAFLACWKEASHEERVRFSDIVKTILGFEKIDPQVISLAEFVDRFGFPFLIADNEIALACKSTALALYFLQRHHKSHPDDMQTVQQLLALNSRMGRIESARGIFASMRDKLDKSDMGMWSEQLGEWERALETYETQQPQKFTSMIKCFAHLELWDEIRSKVEEFEHLKLKEKQECALWFAWAFYHNKDLESVGYFMGFFPEECDLNTIHFNSMFLIASEHYGPAAEYLEDGFRILTDNLSVFNGSDAKEASRRMVFAQHLIELSEALQMKQDIQTNPDLDISFSTWQNRLNNFSHESESWMKLIEIRSLVLSPADHSESYLKMLSVLRKERRWKLIDVYLNRFFAKASSTAVLLAKLKILWGRGSKDEAVSLIKSMNSVFIHEDDASILRAFNKLQPEERKRLVEFLGIKSYDRMTEKQRQTVVKKIKRDPSINAKLLRIQANWQYRQYTAKTSGASSLITICELFQASLRLNDKDYRTWAGWAYASSRSLSHFTDKLSIYALNAIEGFLNATHYRPSESLEYLCQMFSIFFRYGERVKLPENVKKGIIELPPSIVQQIIPQIVVHIAHEDPDVSGVVAEIINQFGAKHFQAVVFALNVLSRVNDPTIAKVAKQFMDNLGSQHVQQYKHAQLLINGMIKSAISKAEMWLTALDTASRAQQMGDRESVIEIIQKAYDLFDKQSDCLDDVQFYNMYKASLQRNRINFERYKAGDQSAHRPMWDSFRVLYAEMDDKVKKLVNIQLSRFSSELAKMEHFELSIPGTYAVEGNSPQLESIDPVLNILSSQQRPRSVYMLSTQGQRYKFLLKGNEDLRLDQRIMQFFNLINALLKNNRNTADLGVSILDYSIVPFAPNAGLITWVTGADTFQQLVTDYRTHQDVRPNLELDIASQFVGNIFNQLSALQRYEVFLNVDSQTQANELSEMLWLRSPDPVTWLQRNRIFTISTALMSMAGYTIGLGDRHPSNIMVQRHTGRCLHIDFGDSFEVAMKRPAFAERVPFRLTRMMINALDSGCVEGLFRKCCQDVLWVLRENKSSIIALMEVFMHEPIFYGKEIKQSRQSSNAQSNNSQSNDSSQAKNNDKKHPILVRVASKLDGNDPAPYDEPDLKYEVELQVDVLIKKASDPREYVRHYVGWCPFW
ncbi:PIKK family atypical protein kinase [Tritrichomonas foetus]|uniref:PIKK family atypical protein kinase n=1 Tax=Tritrichomonas foetus TaxID=1144522 RepID=A0A1J4JL79_9EUKA|nr:PIKK family atypical protein kinase [Tritrichomonas foetus]|eukprot:OHS98309.1 PIKK family atypical protein kinase [Tritrichomonas foetus]